MKNVLLYHINNHPSMTTQDFIKLCYQATFGAEHLLGEKTKAQSYFEREWCSTGATETSLIEPLSRDFVRVHLGAWKHKGLPAEWLFDLFCLTASTPSKATETDLRAKLDEVGELAAQGLLPFTNDNWEDTCARYFQNGAGAVHHSEQYRTAEEPSYRVVDRRYISLISILEKLPFHAKTETQDTPFTIAIDGRAASGKTTIAEALSAVLKADTVHMDDFFLPPELRTVPRLDEPGGNVHYERFAEEVIPHLKNNVPFKYQTFNCQKMCLDGFREVGASQWRVVEGSYCHHPRLEQYMDLRVFCTVSPEEQMRRIEMRNGERMAKTFSERWIPMEEHYFNTFGIRERADIIMETDKKENYHEIDI